MRTARTEQITQTGARVGDVLQTGPNAEEARADSCGHIEGLWGRGVLRCPTRMSTLWVDSSGFAL